MRHGARITLTLALISCLLPAAAQELKLKSKVVVQKVLPGGIAFSPDGRYLAFNGTTGDFDVDEQSLAAGKLNFSITNTKHLILLLEAGSGKKKRELFKGPEKGMGIMFGRGDPVTFSPDGRLLMALYDSAIHVWEAEKGNKVGVWGRDLQRVAFSHDRSFALAKHTDGTLEAYDLKDGRSLGVFPSQEDSELVPLHPERPSIVFVKEQNLVLKNLKTGAETSLGPLNGKRIFTAAVSVDGKLLAVATDSFSLGLWNLAENRKLFERLGDGKTGAGDPIFSPDGSTLLYGWKGKLTLRSLASENETVFDHQHPLGLGELTFADAHTLATRGIILDAVVRLWSFSPSTRSADVPAASPAPSASSAPVTGQGKGFSFTMDRSGNVVDASGPAETSGSSAMTSAGPWKRWSRRSVQIHPSPLQAMSPGPGLKPGNAYLEIALTLENISGQKAEFKYPHPGLFLRRRSTGQRIEPRDLTNEALRKEVEKLNQEGMFKNLAKDFVFSVTFQIDPGKKEEFSVLFEVPRNVSLDDFELHLPDAAPVWLGGSR